MAPLPNQGGETIEDDSVINRSSASLIHGLFNSPICCSTVLLIFIKPHFNFDALHFSEILVNHRLPIRNHFLRESIIGIPWMNSAQD